MYDLNYYKNEEIIGRLSLSRSACINWGEDLPCQVIIASRHSIKKSSISTYINEIYAQHYDADIETHYPMLFSLVNAHGDILAALGFRPAISGALFLEQYLERPIEEYVRSPRSEIVEIGNLASNKKGATILLFTALSAYLTHQGFANAVITSTQSLEKRLKRMSIFTHRLIEANSNLLHKKENWGSYYKTCPHVLTGPLKAGFDCLKKEFSAEYFPLNTVPLHSEKLLCRS